VLKEIKDKEAAMKPKVTEKPKEKKEEKSALESAFDWVKE
jgi:hypothetical protein